MKKKAIAFFAVFIAVLTALSVLTFAIPAKEFSENENRVLAQMPELTLQNVLDGTFQQGLSDFLSDQVPGRDFWIRTNTALKKFLGQKEINGVYLGADGYYFQAFTEESFSASRVSAVFALIEQFAGKQQIPVDLMIVPTPGAVMADKLPANAPFYDADAMWQKLKDATPTCGFVDLRQSFLDAAETKQLYYRTDHHWTTQGAYLAYTQFCQAMGLTPKIESEFGLSKVSDSFFGTIYSKTLDGAAQAEELWAATQLPKVNVTVDGQNVGGIYAPEFLEKKDQYAYFFGGNFGKVEISTGNANGKHLLVFKDSFANAMIPFLLGEYETITMLDLRYFGGNVAQEVADSGATQILFLYEMTNLLTDTGINKLAR